MGHPILSLTVVSGPDLGKRATFDKDHVTIGRDIHNDFVLTDGFVSNWHGELWREPDNVVYYDLRSRHGTLVLIDDISVTLCDATNARHVRVTSGTEIQLGSTLIRLEMESREKDSKPPRESWSPFTSQDPNEHYITTAHRPVEDWTRGLPSSLDVLLYLAGRLNGLTTLEDILDLIVQTTFEAFPAANFFTISPLEDTENALPTAQDVSRTRWTRARPGTQVREDFGEVLLSQSILKRVIETRESVLFVRDTMEGDVTKSILDAGITACLCAPLVGQHSIIGVMQVDTRGQGSLFSRPDLDLFSVLASNAAFALERAQLTEAIYKMFDGFVDASVAAIEDRDPVTAGHSHRVARYTMALAEAINDLKDTDELGGLCFSPQEMVELRYTAQLHDFGKVGVREAVLTKKSRINETELAVICQRFEHLRNLRWRRLADKLLDQLIAQAAPPTAELKADLQADHDAFCAELDQAQQLILAVNKAPRVSDEEVARLRALAARTIIGMDGTLLPLLTADELENLTIQRGNLNVREWEDMRSHVAKSESYLNRIPWSQDLRRIPRFAGAHHEKLDGAGYPRKSVAAEIPDQVRILTIADIFDAITAADRPYRDAMQVPRAAKILQEEAEKGQLDPRFVKVFIDRVIPRLEEIFPMHLRPSTRSNR